MKLNQVDDYRTYLKYAFRQLKEKKPQASISYVARRVGASESFFKKVLSKKTHLGLKYASKLFETLELPALERQILYFWVLDELTDDIDVKKSLRYIRTVLTHRYSEGLTGFNLEDEKKATNMEEESGDLLVHASLEMSRILRRPAEAEDLKRTLLIKDRFSNEDFYNASERAKNILVKDQPGVEKPIHRSKSGPTSLVDRDSLNCMKAVAQLSTDLSADLHIYKPFTIYAGISSVTNEDGQEILKIVRDARKRILEISLKDKSPEKLFVVQLVSYCVSN